MSFAIRPRALLSDAPATQRLAEAEGLWAHALSAALRRRVLEQGEDAVSAESLAAADLTKVAWPGDAVATVAEGVDLAASGRCRWRGRRGGLIWPNSRRA